MLMQMQCARGACDLRALVIGLIVLKRLLLYSWNYLIELDERLSMLKSEIERKEERAKSAEKEG
jgi:uncharacterized small protein (DUF1192 family)